MDTKLPHTTVSSSMTIISICYATYCLVSRYTRRLQGPLFCVNIYIPLRLFKNRWNDKRSIKWSTLPVTQCHSQPTMTPYVRTVQRILGNSGFQSSKYIVCDRGMVYSVFLYAYLYTLHMQKQAWYVCTCHIRAKACVKCSYEMSVTGEIICFILDTELVHPPGVANVGTGVCSFRSRRNWGCGQSSHAILWWWFGDGCCFNKSTDSNH